VVIGLALATTLAGACTPTEPPGAGDHAQEVTLSGEDLRAAFERVRGDDSMLLSRVLAAPDGVEPVALLVDKRLETSLRELGIEARGVWADGVEGPWVTATQTFHEHPYVALRAQLGGAFDGIQLRVPAVTAERVLALTFSVVPPGDGVERSRVRPDDEPMRGDAATLGARPRDAWTRRAASACMPAGRPSAVTLHHTATLGVLAGDPGARLRQLLSYYVDGRGDCDLPWHYVVTPAGEVFTGRALQHAGGASPVGDDIDVALLGCFASSNCPTATGVAASAGALQRAGDLIGALARRAVLPIGETTVAAHGTDACPGQWLEDATDVIRERAKRPARVTAEPPTPRAATRHIDLLPRAAGYWIVAADGGVYGYGSAPFAGALNGRALPADVVAGAAQPGRAGYWLVRRDGAVHRFGSAAFHGEPAEPATDVAGLAPTRSGKGYRVVDVAGAVHTFGDATDLGGLAPGETIANIVSVVTAARGDGYFLIDASGVVHAFGSALFVGDARDEEIAATVVGLAPTATGEGYWLAFDDGQVQAFGDAPDIGDAASLRLHARVTSIARHGSGVGFTLLLATGEPLAFGDADWFGSRAP
jgi:hypothetical protein